jgi:ABC-type glycerol-3-phosphate transport system substrate-binding protein
MPRKILMTGLTVLLLITGVTWIPLFAQNDEIILTVAIDEWQQEVFDDELFALFEAEHPGVKIVPVILSQDARFYGRPYATEQEAIDEYLEKVQSFVAIADVLPVDSYGFDAHTTRTGAFLDLMPLISADPDANMDDFYPALLTSYNWDGGTWALPLSASLQLVVYNKTRFDELRLPYPEATWTINDYVDIGTQLTEYDDSGEVTLPGFYGFDNRLIYRIFLGHNLLDESTFPAQPQFVDADLINIIETWAAFETDTQPSSEDGFNFDFNRIPMTINGLWQLDNSFGPTDAEYGASLLPGGTAGLQVQGYGISAGTPHPELAYEFLQWMTHSPDIANRMFGDRPARRSLVGAEGQLESNFFMPERSEEVEALINEAMEAAIPTSDLQFFDYLYNVTFRMKDEGINAETALQDAQQEALDILSAVEAGSQGNIIVVATPVPTPVLSSGEIALNFGIQSFVMPMPNRDDWITAINEFTAQDSEVRHIELLTDFMGFEEQVETQDCFVLNSNAVQTEDLSGLLPIDPFLAADPNFDRNDLVTGALEQLSSGGSIYAVPLTIQPMVIWYNTTLFEEAGVREPFSGWTVSDFENTLRDYYAATGDPAFMSYSFNGTYIMQLVASYGAQPIDYTTEPYTYNLTDAAFITAAEQVLNLAKEGLIDYQELQNFGGGGGGDTPMYDSMFRSDDWRLQSRSTSTDSDTDEESVYVDPYRIVTFPYGTNVKPISYDISAVYISAQSQHAEACYRWISFFSQRPELLSAMPARRSMIEPAAATIANGDDVLAVYQEIDSLLQDPNVLVLPGQFASGGSSSNPSVGFINFVSTLWIAGAFDAYVVDGADLLTEMQTAQQFIDEFKVCAERIPPPAEPIEDMEQEQMTEYFDQFNQCAIDVDPNMEEFFGD